MTLKQHPASAEQVDDFGPVNPRSLLAKRRNGSVIGQDKEKMLRSLESVLRHSDATGLEAAKALFMIQNNELYRVRETTMKAYGQRWNYSPSYTSRLVQSGKVYYAIETLWSKFRYPRPTSVWQLRPLMKLTRRQQLLAWRQAAKVPGGNPTAQMVEDCAAKVAGRVGEKMRKSLSVVVRLNRVPLLERRVVQLAKSRGLTVEETVLEILADAVGLGKKSQWNSPPLLLGPISVPLFFPASL